MCLKLGLSLITFTLFNFQNVLGEICEEPLKKPKPIFDIRYDILNQQCSDNLYPNSCSQATECTQASGIYLLTLNYPLKRTVTVYCDNENYEGDWLYILRRNDGSEMFNRTWNEYIQGFGNIAGEFWIGLDNLYDLTNFNGPQELNVYLEDFEGEVKFARYDNFAIANAIENYKLKTLGRYWGTAGDSLYKHLGAGFSTIDADHDQSTTLHCADLTEGGFWFSDCGYTSPTATYLRGKNSGLDNNAHWHTFGGDFNPLKTIIFMIRRQKPAKLEEILE